MPTRQKPPKITPQQKQCESIPAASKKCSQLPEWTAYFDRRSLLKISEDSAFMAYFAGPWDDPQSDFPVLLLVHGAGHAAGVWGVLTKSIKDCYRICAYDLRGHGLSECTDTSLKIDLLVDDCVSIAETICSGLQDSRIVVCGHSLGGSIAARAANRIKSIVGCVILDVVETLSLESFHLMDAFIAKMPSTFPSPETAVEWAICHTVNSLESASLSIPQQIVETEPGVWKWRVDLAQSREHWDGWFRGLCDAFLDAPCAKVLMLAGGHHDRLDKPLTLAHMQGKFQLESIPKSGHIIQEDQPEAVGFVLKNFQKRLQLFVKLNWTAKR